MPKSPGDRWQFGGLRCRKQHNPWQQAARLGSPHSELAGLTVRKLPTRPVRRVSRHTRKKAVMIIYVDVGCDRVCVDKRATTVVHDSGYSPERMIANGLVSAVPIQAAVAQWQSVGLSIRKMSVQARSAAPHLRVCATRELIVAKRLLKHQNKCVLFEIRRLRADLSIRG